MDGVLFVRISKTTGYYLSANAKMTGYYFTGVLLVRDSLRENVYILKIILIYYHKVTRWLFEYVKHNDKTTKHILVR